MRNRLNTWVVVSFITVALTPATVWAQATIAGLVRDSSGAVLPGVTVEAASDVLIEKVRTAVTDSTGRYQIVDLRAGTYAVTFIESAPDHGRGLRDLLPPISAGRGGPSRNRAARSEQRASCPQSLPHHWFRAPLCR